MPYKTILLKKEPELKIAWLILNRPDKLNTFNEDLALDLQHGLIEVEQDKDIRVLIITGAGEKAFSAGADITVFSEVGTPERARDVSSRGHELFSIIEQLPQPVIAAINGYAFGGALELALACDFRIAAKRAKIGLTEISLGLFPGWGGTQRLPRLIGLAKAKEAIMLGKRYGAEEALEIGLVNKVLPNETFEDEVRSFAKELAMQAPIALKLIKQCINQGIQVTLEDGLAIEAIAFGAVFATKDIWEGVGAFIQKRKPEFKGE